MFLLEGIYPSSWVQTRHTQQNMIAVPPWRSLSSLCQSTNNDHCFSSISALLINSDLGDLDKTRPHSLSRLGDLSCLSLSLFLSLSSSACLSASHVSLSLIPPHLSPAPPSYLPPFSIFLPLFILHAFLTYMHGFVSDCRQDRRLHTHGMVAWFQKGIG